MLQARSINEAKEHLGRLLEQQIARVEQVKRQAAWTDYKALPTIEIGVLGGDGIGPYIAAEAQRILEILPSRRDQGR